MVQNCDSSIFGKKKNTKNFNRKSKLKIQYHAEIRIFIRNTRNRIRMKSKNKMQVFMFKFIKTWFCMNLRPRLKPLTFRTPFWSIFVWLITFTELIVFTIFHLDLFLKILNRNKDWTFHQKAVNAIAKSKIQIGFTFRFRTLSFTKWLNKIYLLSSFRGALQKLVKPTWPRYSSQ